MPSSPIDPRGSISRRDLTLKRPVWLTFAVMFGIIAIGVAGIAVLWPHTFSGGRLFPFAIGLATVSAVAFVIEPPAVDSWKNNVALLCVPVFTAIGIWAFSPSGVVPIAAAMFVAPFTAGRLIDRRVIIAHYVASTLILLAPIAFLHVDSTARLAMLSMIPATWALAVGCVLVLEAAEQQSEELARIVRRDPLTGIGNRRLLWETFELELPLHRDGDTPLALITMDLNGFKQLNDTLGHDAGDQLLRRVASILEREIDHRGVCVRQGGDEFCVVLPMTTAERAGEIVATLRVALGGASEHGVAISSGFGVATFPEDGDSPDALLAAADRRLTVDKVTPQLLTAALRPAPRPTVHPIPRVVEADVARPFPPAPKLPAQHHLTTQFLRISRAEIAQHRFVWRLIGLMIAMYAVVSASIYALADQRSVAALVFTAGLGVVAVISLRSDPPPMHSWLNHVVIAIPYVGSVLCAFALPQFAGGIIGALAFTGTLTAVRLVSRVAIVAHYLAATALIGLALAFAHLGLAMDISLVFMVLVIFAMGFGDVVYLEAAEEQGRELERLVRRDPLTGAGNRRLLGEQLDLEVRRHQGTRKSFTVVALDLNGFKALNDGIGHAAGDELLQAVAEQLRHLARRGDTVVRQGGDEFCVILPDTDAAAALPIMNGIRAAIANLSTAAHPISTGAGMATFPAEASSGDVLLHVADERLRKDKQSMVGVRRRRRSTDASSPVAVVRPNGVGRAGETA
ncbi:MAG: diguanylate cyclase [Solirubrobacteraceae bacterium]